MILSLKVHVVVPFIGVGGMQGGPLVVQIHISGSIMCVCEVREQQWTLSEASARTEYRAPARGPVTISMRPPSLVPSARVITACLSVYFFYALVFYVMIVELCSFTYFEAYRGHFT